MALGPQETEFVFQTTGRDGLKVVSLAHRVGDFALRAMLPEEVVALPGSGDEMRMGFFVFHIYTELCLTASASARCAWFTADEYAIHADGCHTKEELIAAVRMLQPWWVEQASLPHEERITVRQWMRREIERQYELQERMR